MTETNQLSPMTMRQRLLAVLEGRTPDRIPFIDRLSIWRHARSYNATLPEAFTKMSLGEIHQAVGMGQFLFTNPYDLRLRGVEFISRFVGPSGERILRREIDPELTGFPGYMGQLLAPKDQVGKTQVELITLRGKVQIVWEVNESMVGTGVQPYMREHIIKDEADFPIIEYILEHVEMVPRFERVYQAVEQVGEGGFVVPHIHRIPFQAALLEYLGELKLFYALHDMPEKIERLLQSLHELQLCIIQGLAGLDYPYVEYVDNTDGFMTNPRLFKKYCLPAYHDYLDLFHVQSKKVGSHTDGDLKSLLHLLPESGLDVYESFSPTPLTSVEFEDAWQAWRGKGIIWGGIPSPILEETTPYDDFCATVDRILNLVGKEPFILGIGDQAMGNSLIDRIQTIAEKVNSL